MTTKYNINDKVYDTLNKKSCKVNLINIRENGIYYLVEFNNGSLMFREETHLIRHFEILDKAERRYLKDVIRPFKNKVKYIKKVNKFGKKPYITIELKDDFMSFPNLEDDTMYKNMKIDKKYTLEELDLI